MLLILTGKMCAGKDTIAKKLEHKGFQRIVTYTTRPKRTGEVNGRDYYFISPGEFKNKIKSGFFFEYRTFNPANGATWYYGSALQDYTKITDKQKYVVILNPDGVDKIYNISGRLKTAYKIVYVKTNEETVRIRAKLRGDDKDELERRIAADSADFCCMDWLANQVVWNNDGTEIKSVMNEILKEV